MSSHRDDGTVIPLTLLSFLLAGLLVTAGSAASAAFLAQRDLAGVCDGAALAGAGAAVGRGAAFAGAAAGPGAALAGGAAGRGAADGGILPLDPAAVTVATERYRARAGKPGLALRAGTDGRTVTVECRRTVRIPFGAVLGKSGGLQRTAVARARCAVLPLR